MSTSQNLKVNWKNVPTRTITARGAESHRGALREAKLLLRLRKELFRYRLVMPARIAFQACAIDHSAISPFRIKHLRAPGRAENDLCPNCALTLSAPPHILTAVTGDHRVDPARRCMVAW